MGCQVCGGVPTGGVDTPHECGECGHAFDVHGEKTEAFRDPMPDVEFCPYCGAPVGEVGAVAEFDIWLTPFDMDHLEHGAPVFKGIGEWVRLVLRPGDWDTIERVHGDESEGEDSTVADGSGIGGQSSGPLCQDCGEQIEQGDRLHTVALGRGPSGSMTLGFAHVRDCEGGGEIR